MPDEKNKIRRNSSSDTGKNNDPHLRDDSALQPGISTVSSSETDEADNSSTKTASDDFAEDEFGESADKTFDEVEENNKE